MHCSRSTLAACALVVVLVLGTLAPARADLIVSLEAISAPAGSTGNAFDVILSNDGPDVLISAFSFEVTASSGDLTFTGVNTSTTTYAYIFAGNSSFGPDIAIGPGGTTIAASDLFSIPNSGVTLTSGSPLALGHVLFDVAAASTPTIMLTLTGFPTTSLSDQNAEDLPITTLVGGSISVNSPTVASPEPSTLGGACLGIAIIAAAITARGRRQRARSLGARSPSRRCH